MRGKVEEVPAEALRVLESASRQRAGVVLAELIENAIAHLGGGGIRKGDCHHLARLVHLRKQAQESLGEQSGFA